MCFLTGDIICEKSPALRSAPDSLQLWWHGESIAARTWVQTLNFKAITCSVFVRVGVRFTPISSLDLGGRLSITEPIWFRSKRASCTISAVQQYNRIVRIPLNLGRGKELSLFPFQQNMTKTKLKPSAVSAFLFATCKFWVHYEASLKPIYVCTHKSSSLKMNASQSAWFLLLLGCWSEVQTRLWTQILFSRFRQETSEEMISISRTISRSR